MVSEVVRGHARDAAVFAALNRERVDVIDVDARIGVRAGSLLGAVRSGSAMAVDAFVVAAADVNGGAIIATADPRGMKRLAAHAEGVKVVDVS